MKIAIIGRLFRFDNPVEARPLPSEICGRFTEGFDTPDLQEAKALLDVLERYHYDP